MAMQIAECMIKSDHLSMKCEETLRLGNTELRKETESRMCHFTENLILEFKYLNKRLEDKILFQVGYYQQEQSDERNPVWPDLKITKKDLVHQVSRPRSALNLKLDFDMALEKATEDAGERLIKAYQETDYSVCDD